MPVGLPGVPEMLLASPEPSPEQQTLETNDLTSFSGDPEINLPKNPLHLLIYFS
jgi:hypothetical protein